MYLSELLKERLDKIKVYVPDTLFPPVWISLKEDRCPLCNNKLKFPWKRDIVICNGVKHAKSFVLTRKQFKEIKQCL